MYGTVEAPVHTPLLPFAGRRPQAAAPKAASRVSPRNVLGEIHASADAVRRTIRGRYEKDPDGRIRFLLGDGALDPGRLQRLRTGRIFKIFAVGQGSAAVAADAIARLLRRFLRESSHPLEIASIDASELAAPPRSHDQSDTLVIAVSCGRASPGTIRAVENARDRGAWVIAVADRSDSGLASRAHGVLQAAGEAGGSGPFPAAEAFYALNAAGLILALALAQALRTIELWELRCSLQQLEELPDAMERTLSGARHISELAEQHAAGRQHWAVVGAGPGKIAADEIRIKLGEICGKSIASDFCTDLPAEPLVLVVANGISPAAVPDAVLEVNHLVERRALPLVIADAGEDRFDGCAAGVIEVPVYPGALAYLLPALAGHLFACHAAFAFERIASGLQSMRGDILREASTSRMLDQGAAEESTKLSILSGSAAVKISNLQKNILDGSLDGCLSPRTGARLAMILQRCLARTPEEQFHPGAGVSSAAAELFENLAGALGAAIEETGRPDENNRRPASPHPAAGAGREERAGAGALWSVIRSFSLDPRRLSEDHRTFLAAFEPLVERVHGATLYRIENLDSAGDPTMHSTIRVVGKIGCSEGMVSRSESGTLLLGTKLRAVRWRDPFLGYGRADGKKLLILPLIGRETQGFLLLYHLDLNSRVDRKGRQLALITSRSLRIKLQAAVAERNLEWSPEILDRLDNDTLFLEDRARVAAAL